MKRNSVVRLAVVAVAITALAIFAVQEQMSKTKPAEGSGRMFSGLIDDVNMVSAIEVNSGEEVFTITRSEKDWGVVEKSSYPVKYTLVKELILGIAELELVAAKTKDPGRHEALGLKLPGATDNGGAILVTLLSDEGTVLADLLVGNTFRPGDPRRYVRHPDQDQTWLGGGGVDVGREPLNWVETILTQIRHDRVRSVEYINAVGDRSVLEREDRSGFNFTYLNMPDGMRSLSSSKVNTIAGALAFLNFNDVAKVTDFDFNSDTVIVAIFTTWDGLVVRVSTIEQDGKNWAKIEATFDEGLADPIEVSDDADVAIDGSEGEETDVIDPHEVVRVEAREISDRTKGWVYLFDDTKYSELRRGADDFIELDIPDDAENPEGEVSD